MVLAFESAKFTWTVKPGEKVRMGQPLGYVEWSEEVEELYDRYSKQMEDKCGLLDSLEYGAMDDEGQDSVYVDMPSSTVGCGQEGKDHM